MLPPWGVGQSELRLTLQSGHLQSFSETRHSPSKVLLQQIDGPHFTMRVTNLHVPWQEIARDMLLNVYNQVLGCGRTVVYVDHLASICLKHYLDILETDMDGHSSCRATRCNLLSVCCVRQLR